MKTPPLKFAFTNNKKDEEKYAEAGGRAAREEWEEQEVEGAVQK